MDSCENGDRLMLNIGCGKRTNPEWVNIDFRPLTRSVIRHDIREPLPFDDNLFDVVYHSHVLEHLTRAKANSLVSQCYRVLRPGGIIRIVVPDLEELARNYLNCLEDARELTKDKEWMMVKYQWSVIEMLDQLVRERHGGEMLEFIRACEETKLRFVRERLGSELDTIIQDLSSKHLGNLPARSSQSFRAVVKRSMRRCLNLIIGQKTKIRDVFGWHARNQQESRSGSGFNTFQESGELHKWMYDSCSLSKLLEFHAFTDIERMSHSQSKIRGWSESNLDVDTFGSPYKPNSLIMEAVKPMISP